MMKKKLLLFMFPVLAVMLFFALSAHATLIESGLPGGGPDQEGLKPGTEKIVAPAEYIRYLYLFVMGFVGIAGVVTLVIWGTVWTASGVVDKKAMAMEGIKNTLYGIGLALSAYIFLYTINPDLTVIKTPTIEKVDTKIEKLVFSECSAYGALTAAKCKWLTACSNATLGPNAVIAPDSNYCKIELKPTLTNLTYNCCIIPK